MAPVVLLVAVVGGGLVGQAGDDRPAPSPPAASARVAEAPSPNATTTIPTPGVAGIDGNPGVDDGVPAYPRVVANLRVLTVPEALDLRSAAIPDRPVAIAGYLGIPTPATDCPGSAGGLGPLCGRRGILAEQPWVTRGAGIFASLGVHLHPDFPVGVLLPDAVERSTRAVGGDPVPVVLVGRFQPDGRACRAVGPPCEARFLVDRVMWADGEALAAGVVVDTGVDTLPTEWTLVHADDARVAAVGWTGTPLVTALVRPATIALVDRPAWLALREAPPTAGLVWYVRGLDIGYDPTRYPLGQSPPRLSWAIVDDVSGEVIVRGTLGQSPA
jgi:hypothetical protein